MKIILISHSNMAVGMKQTLSMIVGDNKEVMAFAAYINNDTSSIEKVKKFVSENSKEQIIILTDLLGGSVNNEMMQLLKNHSNLYVITGMNLPLAMQLQIWQQSNESISDDQLENIINDSQKALIDVNKLVLKERMNTDDQIL
ncbi:PTS sugar transporter subunit IIA [Companilactobacillus hulinensis]|uniref:PTS sugar transporter subunit IIA n=1 Tax=Companilactobacillus hulinensis TaxID=2486007 RepID=UPI000F776868|nr:PTS sugar transporter subunit IIA [Companilactobacillus hulinensis]